MITTPLVQDLRYQVEEEYSPAYKMKRIIKIFLFVLVMLSLVITVSTEEPLEAEEIVTYTPSTDTTCNNGVCNLILWSGIRNVYEDGNWKRVEDAISLKDKGFEIVYLENDPAFNIIVNDFNISYLDMDLEFLGDPNDYLDFCQVAKTDLGANCDFKLDEKWEEFNETTGDETTGEMIEKSQLKFQYKWERDKDGIITKGDKYKYEYKGNPFGKKFKFGGNSTTIQLQDADTENLEDVELSRTSGFIVGLIKFNLSAVPSGQVIDNASFHYQVVGSPNPTDNDLNIYRLDDQAWTEDDSITSLNDTWNTHTDLDSTQTIETTVDTWGEMNVTLQVRSEYDAGSSNISLGFEDPDNLYTNNPQYINNFGGDVICIGFFSPPVATKELCFASKEYATTSLRPYLNITYTEAGGDTCSPDSPLSADHTFTGSDDCSITTDLNAGGNDIYLTSGGSLKVSGSGHIRNFGNIFAYSDVYCYSTSCFG